MIIKLVTTQTQRLDEYLRLELPSKIAAASKEAPGQISNSKIRRLIVSGNVIVNGSSVVRPAYQLRGRSQVQVNFEAEKFFYEKQPDDIAFTMTDESVLFEDENLIFINKPAFFPVEQTITGNRANLHDAVVDYLWKRNPALRNPPYVGIMHRLDRETSGVILFTKNRAINKAVSELFQTHEFTKIYTALCAAKDADKLNKKQFTVEMYMGRISGKSQAGQWGQTLQEKGGQYSKTDFTVKDFTQINGVKAAEIECKLYTGRTHQIRVHLSSRKLPIIGDTLYGGIAADRIYLHAKRLAADFTASDGTRLMFDVQAKESWKGVNSLKF